MGALPALRVSRLIGGPIAAAPYPLHVPGGLGVTSQMGGAIQENKAVGNMVFLAAWIESLPENTHFLFPSRGKPT